MVHPAHPVRPPDLAHTIDGPTVESIAFLGGVLDLQARFDVLDGGGDERYGRAGQDARHAVAVGGERQGIVGFVEGVQRRVEEVIA